MTSDQARVAVIAVSWRDDPRLGAALASLPDDHPLDLIVVENGAEGPAPDLPREPAHRLRRSGNPGFSGGFEDALALTDAPFVLSLTPDVRLDPGALAAALEVLGAHRDVGAIALRLLRPGREVLDAAGISLGPIRRARDRGMGAPAAGAFLEAADVDAACMACALFRREALEAARDGAGEVLDRRFLAYKEDVDLGWRLRRAGWRIRYVPEAVAEHERGWREGARSSIPARVRIWSLRNRWLTTLKNERGLLAIPRLAVCILVEVGVAFLLLVREPRTLAAYPAILRTLPETLRRRARPTRTR